jgi:alpha-tubulin suppressor-like RCC1 family protein
MPRTLHVGMSGDDVQVLQKILNARLGVGLGFLPKPGFTPLAIDGKFGPITQQRVIKFQQKSVLNADGVVGPLTWGKLLKHPVRATTGFCVLGRHLFDAGGTRIIPRGINVPVLDGLIALRDFPGTIRITFARDISTACPISVKEEKSMKRSFDVRFLLAILLFAAPSTVLAMPGTALEVGARNRTTRISASSTGTIGHTCAVKQDGTVQCWGENLEGQLGNGAFASNQSAPVVVQLNNAPLNNVVSVVAGGFHTCALKAQGTVFCWGFNLDGQLGNGTTSTGVASPVQVRGPGNVGFLSNVVALAAGTLHTCALLVNGTVQCWGSNGNGQLGNGDLTQADQTTPVQARGTNNSGVLDNVVSLGAGLGYTCALLGDGTVRCWGSNSSGQLGNGDATGAGKFFPVAVVGLSDVTNVAIGGSHACALLAAGTMQCWGSNSDGQLGNGTSDSSRHASPISIPSSTLSDVQLLAAGSQHTCALMGNGTVRCWGRDNHGQLGDGGTSDVLSPPNSSISGLTNMVFVAPGISHTCALQADDAIRCWGDDSHGQLGNGDPLSDSSAPVIVTGGGGTISGRGIAAGNQHTCARRASSAGACWGDNVNGQLGNTGTADSSSPTTIKTLATRSGLFVVVDLTAIKAIAGGGLHTCELGANGSVRCWGANGSGQLGNGGTGEVHFAPAPSIGGLANVSSIVAGDSDTCVLLVNGKVQCWGENSLGQLGNHSSGNDSSTPVTVQILSEPVGGLSGLIDLTGVAALAAGFRHNCALRADGTVVCWGDNRHGQLGKDPLLTSSSFAIDVAGVSNAIALAGGNAHTCALLSNGKVKCWGLNNNGQLGDGSINESFQPVTVRQLLAGGGLTDLTGIVALEAGSLHTCALRVDGKVFCWGDNTRGQLGDGTMTDSHAALLNPVQQVVLEGRFDLGGIVALGLGQQHSCALGVDGQPFCWGSNSNGQLGNGGNSDSPLAQPVPSFTFNVAAGVSVRQNERVAVVTALANCPEGDMVHIDVQLSQNGTIGQGQTEGRCTGGLTGYPVIVPAQGRVGWQAGEATALADAVVRDRGRVVQTQEWTRVVELSVAP